MGTRDGDIELVSENGPSVKAPLVVPDELLTKRQEAFISILQDEHLNDDVVRENVSVFLKEASVLSQPLLDSEPCITCCNMQHGWTALHVIAHTSAKGVVRSRTLALLLEHKADAARRDAEGLTAAWYVNFLCEGALHATILEQLVGATDLTPIWRQISCPDPEKPAVCEMQDVCMHLLHHAMLQKEFSENPTLAVQAVQLLLDARSDPNARILDPSSEWARKASIHGFGPLHLAVRGQNVEVVKLLLCAAADANAATSEAWVGPDLLGQLAIGFGMHPVLKLTSVTPLGVLALPVRRFQSAGCWHRSAVCRAWNPAAQAAIMRQLIVACADTSVTVTYELSNFDDSSLAHGFLSADSLAVLLEDERGSRLANRRANSLETELRYATPLLAVICRCKQNFAGVHPLEEIPRKVSLLLDARADIHGSTDGGLTALHILAATAWPAQLQDAVFDKLLSSGAVVNAVSNSGHGALHVAAAFGTPHMLEKLLSSQADVGLTDLKGRTAFHFAVTAHAENTYENVSYDVDPSEDNGILKISCLLNAHADPEQLDGDGRSLLHHVVGSLDLRGLEPAAKVSRASMIKGSQGNCGLHDVVPVGENRAWSGKEFENLATLVEALISRGGGTAFLSAKDSVLLETPLHIAARCSRTWSVQVLVSNSADVNALDSLGRTPLYWAGVQALLDKDEGVRSLLLDLGAQPSTEIATDVAPLRVKYDLKGKLAEGRFGSVYLAQADACGLVALKIQASSSSSFSDDSLSWKEFVQNESAIMAKLVGHQNLAELKEWCFEGPLHLMALGLLEGPCIFGKFAFRSGDDHDDPLSEAYSLRLFSQILSGLKHMHDLNIIHRDVKPNNCLLSAKSADARAVLVDFGLAREMPSDGTLITKSTYSYDDVHGANMTMSPEKELAKYDLDEKSAYGLPSDIWCVGVLAYILLTGMAPYPDAPDSFRPPKIPLFSNESWKFISSTTQSLISSMLELNPMHRPTAREAIEQLNEKTSTGSATSPCRLSAAAELKKLFREYAPRSNGFFSADEFAKFLTALGDETIDPTMVLPLFAQKLEPELKWDDFVDWLYSDD